MNLGVDHKVKIKENENKNKKDQNLDFTRELKMLWNMKVTVIPNLSDSLKTTSKGLVKRLEELEIKKN